MSFTPTPNAKAAQVWRDEAKKAKNKQDREDFQKRADQCQAMADEEAAATAEADSANTEAAAAAVNAGDAKKPNECWCGKDFPSPALLGKHKKTCEVAKLHESEEE